MSLTDTKERNIIVTVLSTLPNGVSVVENVEDVVRHHYSGIINQTEFIFDGRSQLEAGTKYYLKKAKENNKRIDEIVVIGSKETSNGTNLQYRFQQREAIRDRSDSVFIDSLVKLSDFNCDDRKKDALDIYLYGIKEYCEKENIGNYYDIDVTFVSQDKDGLLNIEEIKNVILDKEFKTNIYLDIQGGKRITNNIVFNLINTLRIVGENIEISQIISINFDPTDNNPSLIVDETDNMTSIELTNALESFYVSLDSTSLEKYYQNRKKPEIVSYIIKLSEAVMFNDVVKIEKILMDVYNNKNSLKEIETNDISSVIIHTFAGDLIEEITQIFDEEVGTINQLKLIKWCNDKNLIKQALTLIENKIPKLLIDRLNISLDVVINGTQLDFFDAFINNYDGLYNLVVHTFQRNINHNIKQFKLKQYEPVENNLFELIFNIPMNPHNSSIYFVDNINRLFNNNDADFESLIINYFALNCDDDGAIRSGENYHYSLTDYPNYFNFGSYQSNFSSKNMVLHLSVHNDNQTKLLIFGYYALKEQRNKINHFDGGTTIRFEKIKWIIDLYIDEFNRFLTDIYISQNLEKHDECLDNIVITNLSIMNPNAKETRYYKIEADKEEEICITKQQQIPGTIYFLRKLKHISNIFVVGSKKIFGNLDFAGITSIDDIIRILEEHKDIIDVASLEFFRTIKNEIENSTNTLTIDKVTIINNTNDKKAYPKIVVDELRDNSKSKMINIYIDTQGYKRSFFNMFYNTIHTLRIFNKNVNINEAIAINYNGGHEAVLVTRTEDILSYELMNGLNLLYNSNRVEILNDLIDELSVKTPGIIDIKNKNYLKRLVTMANNINSLSIFEINKTKQELINNRNESINTASLSLKDFFFTISERYNSLTIQMIKVFNDKIKNEFSFFLTDTIDDYRNDATYAYRYAKFLCSKNKYLEAITVVESCFNLCPIVQENYENNPSQVTYHSNIDSKISNIENELLEIENNSSNNGNTNREIMDYYYFVHFSDYAARREVNATKWLQKVIDICDNHRTDSDERGLLLSTINKKTGPRRSDSYIPCSSEIDLLYKSIHAMRNIFNHAKSISNQEKQIIYCKYFLTLFLDRYSRTHHVS